MADTTIDSLQIEIQSSSTSASKGLDALCQTLDKLKSATKGGLGLTSIASGLEKLNNSVSKLNAMGIGQLGTLVTALNNLKGIQGIKISSTVAKSIGEIADASTRLGTESIVNIRLLASSLQDLASVGGIRISSTVGTSIRSISEAAATLNTGDLSKIHSLSSALASLSAISGVKIPSTIAARLVDIGIAAEQLQGIDFGAFTTLATNLNALSNIGRVNLNSTINQLSRLPQVMEDLSNADLDRFTDNVQRLVQALQPLATQMNTISRGFSRFPEQVQRVSQSTLPLNTRLRSASTGFTSMFSPVKKLNQMLKQMTSVNGKLTVSYADLYAKVRLASNLIHQAANKIATMINASNAYVENLNLFTVSLGQFAEQAQDYGNTVAEVMGIDPSEWMRNQGVFMTLSTGFGVAADRAHTMSEQLTQLGYDLSSFFNISVADAMQKLQSGLSGELEPLRRLGFDLSQARLKAVALELGITKSFNAMTQAEKAQLRYYAIMTQVTTAHGDLARTLETPANQMRIFKASVDQAGRALGNIFIPALSAVLPFAIAAAKAVRILADAVAKLFGYKLPEIDYSGVVSGIDDTSDSLGNIGDSADGSSKKVKALQSVLMGFDEINQLKDPTQSGGGSGSGSGANAGGWADFELPTYDFLGDITGTKADEWLKKIMDTIRWIADMVREGDFSPLGEAISDKINDALDGINWGTVQGGAQRAADLLSSLLNGFFGDMNPRTWGRTIGQLINTATRFISNFWSKTDWYMVGVRVKDMIGYALSTIDPMQLAKALMGKFNAGVMFLVGLLPDTADEWDILTDRISQFISSAIDNIPEEHIGEIIGNVIMAGISFIKSLADEDVLVKLANKIVGVVKSATEKITPEQVEAALGALLDEIVEALGVLMKLTVKIGDVEFSAAGLVITGLALWNALKTSFGNLLSLKGFGTGAGGFRLFAGIGFALDAVASIANIFEDEANGKGLDFNKVVDVAKSAFTSMGFFLSSAGKTKEGGIAVGIGAAFELVGSVSDVLESVENGGSLDVQKLINVVSNSFTKLGLTLIGTGNVEAGLFVLTLGLGMKLVTKVVDFIGDITNAGLADAVVKIQNAYGDIALTAQQLQRVDEIVRGINDGSVNPAFTLWMLALQDEGAILAEVMKRTGLTVENLGTQMGYTDDQINTIKGTMSSATDAMEEMPVAVDEVLTATDKLNRIDTSGVTAGTDAIGSAFDDTIPHITAAGDEAETVGTKVVEIPTERAIAIDITNYTTLISNLDSIKGKFDDITKSVNSLRLNALANLQKAIDGMRGTTLTINVRAGLTSGARNFLWQLGNIDSGMRRSLSAVLNASQFASGGYPTSGELFIAGENGRSELVGRIGNRAAVANQDQIGEAIFRYMDEHDSRESDGPSAEAIGAAVASALKAAGIGAVYLDGRDLADSINRETKRSGKPAIRY